MRFISAVLLLALVSACGETTPDKAPETVDAGSSGGAGTATEPGPDPLALVRTWIAAGEQALATRTHANEDHAIASRAQADAAAALRLLAAKPEGLATVQAAIQTVIAEWDTARGALETRMNGLRIAGRAHSPEEARFIKSVPAQMAALATKIEALLGLLEGR